MSLITSHAIKRAPTLANLRTKRDDILSLAERYGAYNLRVFGSVVRGEAKPESDIDLLVSFRHGASLYDLSGLRQDLVGLLGCQLDVVSDHPGLRERFRRRLNEEAVPL